MLQKLINFFRKSKKNYIKELTIIEFRKDLKKYINQQEGGNIPGAIIRPINLYTEKFEYETKSED